MILWGRVDFKINGSNISKLFSKIFSDKIKCKGLYCQDNSVIGSCSPFTWKIISELCDELQLTYEIKYSYGLYTILNWLIKRKGLLIGFLLGMTGIVFLSGLYLKTDIDGCNSEIEESIINYLSSRDINYGMSLDKIDLYKLELELMKNVDGISWAGIYTTGGTLNINILESDEKPEYNQRRLPSDLIASRDGQIVEVEIFGGQLVVPVGSGVHKGQVIVSGLVDLDEEKKAYRRSQGKIYAKYTEEMVFECDYISTRKIVGKETEKKYYLEFFSLDVPMFFSKPAYDTYNTYETVNQLSLLDMKLPLGIKSVDFVPYSFEKTEYSYNEACEEVYRLKENYEINFLSDCEVLDIKEELTSDDTGVKLIATYEIISDIAVEKEILIK